MFELSHFLGDFVLKTNTMAAAGKFSHKIWPMIFHSIIHGFLFSCAVFIFDSTLWTMTVPHIFAYVTVLHFIIDYSKGIVSRMNADFTDVNKHVCWTIFGFDQFAHQCVIVFLMYLIIFGYMYN
jgi:hypothetical protein